VVNQSEQKFQVIILDHTAENIWGNIKGIHKAAEWRDGEKLIPEDWL
jgi:hypothetical protein